MGHREERQRRAHTVSQSGFVSMTSAQMGFLLVHHFPSRFPLFLCLPSFFCCCRCVLPLTSAFCGFLPLLSAPPCSSFRGWRARQTASRGGTQGCRQAQCGACRALRATVQPRPQQRCRQPCRLRSATMSSSSSAPTLFASFSFVLCASAVTPMSVLGQMFVMVSRSWRIANNLSANDIIAACMAPSVYLSSSLHTRLLFLSF